MVSIDSYKATLGSDSVRSARLPSRQLTFGLEPVFQFTARLCPASEIKFVSATPDFVVTPGHTEHDLAVRPASCRSRPAGRPPMNPWQVPGDVLPGLGRILERVHGRDVWSYRPLFQQSPDSAEHVH